MAPTRPRGERPPDFKNYQLNKSIKNRRNGISSGRWAKILWHHSRDWAEWLRQDPLIDGDKWQPVRPLGQGGFGRVGLWNSTDAAGKVVDEIVIKEQQWSALLDVGVGKPGLTREAVLHFQLNEKAANVPLLRNFKYLQDTNEGQRKNRLYFEFCRNGDLDKLKLRYFAWGRCLPEPFLWHVFESLAEVVMSMSQDGWHDYSMDKDFSAGWNLLHMDLKPENVLVGDAKRGRVDSSINEDSWSAYPAINVHDFGLSVIANKADNADNPLDIIWRGTADFFSPEQRHYSIHWTRPLAYPRKPFLPAVDSQGIAIRPLQRASDAKGNDRPLPKIESRSNDAKATSLADYAADGAGLKFDQSVNIWGIGKIMFDLTTLSDSTALDDQMNKISEKTYYESKDSKELPDIKALLPVDQYSDRLLDLICNCLRFDKDDRPSPEALVADTKSGLKEAGSRSDDIISKDEAQLFFSGNDINNMTPGPAPFKGYLLNNYDQLVDSTYFDVDLPVLRPPKQFLDLAMKIENYGKRKWQPPASDNRRPMPWRVVDGRVRGLQSGAGATTTATPAAGLSEPVVVNTPAGPHEPTMESATPASPTAGPSQAAGANIPASPERPDDQQDDEAHAPDVGDGHGDDDHDGDGNGDDNGVPLGVAHEQAEYEAMYVEELYTELTSRGEAEATLKSMKKAQRVARLVVLDVEGNFGNAAHVPRQPGKAGRRQVKKAKRDLKGKGKA